MFARAHLSRTLPRLCLEATHVDVASRLQFDLACFSQAVEVGGGGVHNFSQVKTTELSAARPWGERRSPDGAAHERQ